MLIEKKPLISIVVPVYKVERYIRRCVDSIMNQSYREIEVWLVDDGSPDDCGRICDTYARNDDRIHVIHKRNGGLSDARNVAIPKCSGKYITFVDSDDWVSQYYIEHLYSAAIGDNADMAISWFENVDESERISNLPQEDLQERISVDSKECFRKLLYQDGVETSAWGKLYKKELFEGLKYPVGKLYEDIPVTTQLIHRSKKISIIKNVDYYYFQRRDSIQYETFNQRKMDAIDHVIELKRFIDTNYSDLKTAACCRILSTTFNILFQINDVDKWKQDYDRLWNIIEAYRLVTMKDSSARKKTRIASLLSYLGYPISKFIYKSTQMRG